MKAVFHARTKQQIDNFLDQPSHALSIVAETGAGKGFTAKYIAANLLNTSIEKIINYPYIKQLACSQTAVGIEQVRDVQQFLTLAVPGDQLVRRILVLENIECLGREAQNALLKTLEDTPPDSVIICTIARRDYVLPTIHSRMQRINLLPLPLEKVVRHFEALYNIPNIEKAYLMSGGYLGLMSAILADDANHPLVLAINKARLAIGQSRYERLLGVDSMIKGKDISSAVFLDGLYRLLHASYKQGVLKGRSKSDLSTNIQRLHMVEQAADDLESKVSEKLVLSRLLFSL